MKTVEQVLNNMSGVKYFSMLGAKSGFCQLPPDEDSSYLTMFNTLERHFQWLRQPFGIKSAPEIYQRTMDSMLEGTAIMDDIIIEGKTVEDYNKVLKQVLRRSTE